LDKAQKEIEEKNAEISKIKDNANVRANKEK
jgi:hypothetical protein